MIDELIYPKQDASVQLGIRRIPLHYLSEELGGNGVLQHDLLDLCDLQKQYVECKNVAVKQVHGYRFNSSKEHLINREENIYNNFLDMIDNSDSKYKEQIKFDLTNYYYSLIDFIGSVEL